MSNDNIVERYNIVGKIFGARNEFQEKSYINREFYEKEYQKALALPKCIIVKGCSGSGKTWLTKYILSKSKIKSDIINLSDVLINKSLNEYLKLKLGDKIHTSLSEDKKVSGKALIAEGCLSTLNMYQMNHNYFLEYCKSKKNHYIVFDNIESITNCQAIVEELGSVITMMDDYEIQKCNIKFIIIGTNNDIKGFFDNSPNYETISNRLFELTEIKGYNDSECYNHLSKRFYDKQLGIEIKDMVPFNDEIFKSTNGIPQNINDLCTQICFECIDRDIQILDKKQVCYKEIIDHAKTKWIKASFSGNYSHVVKLFNENVKSNNRNNYILFMLSEIDKYEFTPEYFKIFLSDYIPKTESMLTIKNIKDYLNKLAIDDNNNNILEKNNNEYTIRNYKTILCIRNMLYLDANDDVCKYDLSEL